MTIEALKKQIQENTFSSLYYLLGEEQYLIDFYSDKLKDSCAAVLPEFNYIEIDGKKPDFDFLADACTAYPVMAERKLVVVADLEPSMVKGQNEKKLLAALGDIAPGVTVLFRDHAKEKAKSNALETLIKKLGGEIVKTERLKPEAMAVWIRKMAAKSNIEISSADCAYLYEMTGGSMLRVHNEMQKMIAFLKEGEIDRALIDRMVAPEENASWFAISNALAAHDFDQLMQTLHDLYSQNTDDTVIAGMFHRAFIDLWRGETALKEGKSSAELAMVSGISPYAAANIMRSAARLKEGEALDGIRKCRQLDRKLKTSGVNKKDLIYGFAAELLAFQMKDHE